MTALIVNLILVALFFNLNTSELYDSSQIIVNSTMPKKTDDVIFREDGGDISREVYYPNEKESVDAKPSINALSSIVIDAKSGLVLFDKNSKAKLSIASITKLMTALVFLDQQSVQGDKLNWDMTIDFSQADFKPGRRYLGTGERITIRDLFSLMLIGSANSATSTLVRSTGLLEEDFVKKMNEKSVELKMNNSSFDDVTGLSEYNISTARDLSKLVYMAMQNPEILSVVTKAKYDLVPSNKKITHVLYNTNKLIEDSWFEDNNYKLVGGKTGYTDQAGYSFSLKVDDDKGNSVIGIILNTNSLNNRFSEAKKIIEWSFKNYNF